MGVHNTTGAMTLFIYAATLITTAAFLTFRRKVGRNFDQVSLIREGAWYAVDVSMVLNAMLRGAGVTDMVRMQQCDPPMPTRKLVFEWLDQWYRNHGLAESVLVFVFDGRRCPHKGRNVAKEEEVNCRVCMYVYVRACVCDCVTVCLPAMNYP